jgi:hypothetical protein
MRTFLPGLLSSLLLCFFPGILSAQKKVVVMGSSTAFGAATSHGDSAWVSLMSAHYRKNPSDGVDTSFSVVGGFGHVTYYEMPDNFVPPPGRPFTVTGHNVDAALALSPDIVIINLPTNDMAAGYTKKEMMNNLRLLRSYILQPGRGVSSCYIATTQPRNDLSVARRDSLRTLVDSIRNNFGFYSINFWDDLARHDGSNLLRDDVRNLGAVDEDYHLNDLGHRFLFQRARDKQIFAANIPLPLVMLDFGGVLVNGVVELKWSTTQEEIVTSFEVQHSSDALSFSTKGTLNGRGDASYSWTDRHPTAGKNLYRLKIIESGRVTYSKTINIVNDKKELALQKLYINTGGELVAEIASEKTQTVVSTIINATGSLVYKQVNYLTATIKKLSMPVSKLPAGQYYLTIHTDDGNSISRPFIRQ